MSTGFKKASVGDWVEIHFNSVISRANLPMIVTHVDDSNPAIVSGVAFSAKPETHGWPDPVHKIVNARFGEGHYQWSRKSKKEKKLPKANGEFNLELIADAIKHFDKNDQTLWTSIGEPSTKALSQKLGFRVSSKDRSKALEMINA